MGKATKDANAEWLGELRKEIKQTVHG